MEKTSLPSDKAIGDILKIYRKSNRMTQKRVADYLGVSRSAYAKYETMMRTPHIDVIIKLAALYNTSIDDFFSPFSDNTESVLSANAEQSSDEMQLITKSEKLLLDYFRASVRKSEIIKAAEEIYNADIEIVKDTKE